MIFILEWLIFYGAIMFAMSLDNYSWIPADRKWFHTKEWKPHFYVLFVAPGKKKREYLFPKTKEGWRIVRHRIKDVLTQQYDIVPAVIASFILMVII